LPPVKPLKLGLQGLYLSGVSWSRFHDGITFGPRVVTGRPLRFFLKQWQARRVSDVGNHGLG
jgi:hypothetical protein